jgi:autotransporter-associated beta strand protein
VIADANNDGLLLVAGAPSVVTVVNAGDTATVSRVLGGSGGLTKAGAGVLNLTTNNAYTGVTTVSAGILRLARGNLLALGATGTGNDTVVAAGATLDFNGAYVNSGTAEKFTISGAGTDGKGVLVNKGADMTNRDISEFILQDDATVGGAVRFDVATVTGNGKTFTKNGTLQLCVKNLVNATVVINEGMYTMLGDSRALGGTTPGDTTVNGGTLNAWNTMTVPERITFNGGAIAQGNPNMQLLNLSGYLTVNSNVNFSSGSITNGVELSGYVDGPGGFTQTAVGWCYFTGNTNAYTGPTTINSNCPLYVGKTNLYSGVLGLGTVTNNGRLYGYSSRICQGNIVNGGNMYLCTGLLSAAGSVLNNGTLYVDRGGTFSLSNVFSGTGNIFVRSNANVAVSGGLSTNGELRIGFGSFSLANGASLRFTRELQIADRLSLNYLVDPTNVTAIMNIPAGCTLMAQAATFGNGTNVLNGGMTSVVNHAGTVITTGAAAEGNGIRLGHYPQAYSVYNMQAGTLTIGADYDLSCATDGTGWFNQTGGEVYTKRVMLNERNADGGFGRLTVAGGVLNLGTLTGAENAFTNGIMADAYARYLVELGGAGGTIRAATNVWIPASATLYGTNETSITFDSQAWTITLTNRLTGAGGLNKSGAGDLVLRGTNTYAGATRILQGRVLPVTSTALPAGGEVRFRVTASDDGGRLHSDGDLSLSAITVAVDNPEDLDKTKSYTIATYGGALTGGVTSESLPGAWYVFYDWPSKRVQLKAAVGTIIRLQ